MITPRRPKLSGKLVVLVPHYFTDKGQLSMGHMVPNGRDVKKSCADGAVRDSIVDYLCDGNA